MRIFIKLFYTFLCVFGLASKLAAAELVVPFSDGFFGDHNDGSTITAENVQLFSTIGLDLNFFAQSSGGASFEDADNNTLETISCNGGNDVPGRLRIRAGGYFTDIPGCIDGKYKDGGVTKAYNFNPAAVGPISYTNSSGGTTTINIQDNSYTALNIGVIKNPTRQQKLTQRILQIVSIMVVTAMESLMMEKTFLETQVVCLQI